MRDPVLIVLIICSSLLLAILGYSTFQDAVRQSAITPVRYVEPTAIPSEYTPKPVSIDTIFSSDHDWTATLSGQRTTTLVATGDVLTAREVNRLTTQRNNFHWPFEKTAHLLQSGDVTIINLETPLVENCPTTSTGMIFCGDVRNVEGLLFAGVDVVNLANNHMGNWGQEGVDTTVRVLSDAGLLPVGVANPVYKEVNGMRFAFLGYNDIGRQAGVSHVDDRLFEEETSTAQEQADIVIISFHWGVEYTHQPTDRQKEIARMAIDAGADLVIGNHPHWIQPPEMYQGKLIVYSHGNFVFDQMWSQKTREGIVSRYTFYDTQLIDAEFIPIIIEDYGQPRLAEEIEQEDILNIIKQEAGSLTTP